MIPLVAGRPRGINGHDRVERGSAIAGGFSALGHSGAGVSEEKDDPTKIIGGAAGLFDGRNLLVSRRNGNFSVSGPKNSRLVSRRLGEELNINCSFLDVAPRLKSGMSGRKVPNSKYQHHAFTLRDMRKLQTVGKRMGDAMSVTIAYLMRCECKRNGEFQ